MEIGINWPPVTAVACLIALFLIAVIMRIFCCSRRRQRPSASSSPEIASVLDGRPLAIPILDHEMRRELGDDCMVGFPLQSALAIPVVTGVIISDDDDGDDGYKTPINNGSMLTLDYPQSDYLPRYAPPTSSHQHPGNGRGTLLFADPRHPLL